MSFLKPKHLRNPSGRPLPEYRTLDCPKYGHRNTWCRLMCTPIGTKGECGRLAPHAMVSKTQAAIAAFNASQASD